MKATPRLSAETLDSVFEELRRIQEAPEGPSDLVQFRALSTAHQYLPVYDAIARHFRPGDRLLDWGCGNGHVSWTLLRLGWSDVTGFAFERFPLLDRMPASFDFVSGAPDEPVALPLPDESFDGVLSVGVLEHVSETGGNEEDSLVEIRRVLRPGGRFLCAHFPNRGSWIEFVARRLRRKYHHPRLFDREDVRRLARGADLRLEEFRSYGFLPRNGWAAAPATLRRSPLAARFWDRLDRALTRLFPRFVQNHLWVARRRRDRG